MDYLSDVAEATAPLQVDMSSLESVQRVLEQSAPDTPKKRSLEERRAMLAKGKRCASHHTRGLGAPDGAARHWSVMPFAAQWSLLAGTG